MKRQSGRGREKKPASPNQAVKTVLPVVLLMDATTLTFMKNHGGRMPSQKELCKWLEELYKG